MARQRSIINFSKKASQVDFSWLSRASIDQRHQVLEQACRDDNEGWVLFLGKTGYVNPIRKNAAGDSPMHVAAAHGSIQAIKALQELGVDKHIRNKEGL